MFDTPADIERAFEALDYSVPQTVIEQVMEIVTPIISFESPKSDASSALGMTRFGGAPDMAPGAEWPRLPTPEGFGEIVPPYKNYDFERVNARMESQAAYAFVGQVALSDMPETASAAALLPDTGRLLFFYDLASYDIGIWTAKVIWDTTPVSDIETVAFPDDLLATHRQDYAEVVKNDKFDADLAKEYDNEIIDPATLPETSQFIFPVNPAAPVVGYTIPSQMTLEFQQLGETTFEVDGEEFWLSDTIYELEDLLMMEEPAALYNFVMAGPPNPEQDDPRFDAAHIAGGEATDWILLLEVDVAGLMQRNTEGTIYYLIRKDDLEKQNFDRVVGVYQQT